MPALVNLANIHYSRDELVEAQALYERAIGLEPDFFEAHFNLGNIYHDLGRFPDAQVCYRDAVALNPGYPDAHFYLAVTLEKMGQSPEAKPHWRAYQELAPQRRMGGAGERVLGVRRLRTAPSIHRPIPQGDPGTSASVLVVGPCESGVVQ